MTNIFPIGNSQQFDSASGLVLNIRGSDYTTNLNLIGYNRTIKPNYLKSVIHQINGTPSIKGVRHNRFFTYEWSLQLNQARYDILSAMWYEQTDKINTYATSDIGIKLFDARQVLLVRSNPRQRAKILNTPLPADTPVAPANFEYIYPIFSIFITDLQIAPLLLANGLFNVTLKADELVVLPITDDE